MGAVEKEIKVEFQKSLEELQRIQKEIQNCVEAREKLETQLNENKVVKEELDLLESSANVYKLTGPVLVKQDLEEAKDTVSKRIAYINGEVKRQETSIEDFQKEQEKHRDSLTQLQGRLQPPPATA